MNILIKNAHILTMDDQQEILNGFLGTQDKKIKFVSDKIEDGYTWDYEIDAKGGTLMPGLCNAHSHVAMTILRNYSEGYKLQDWLFQKIFPIEEKMTAEHIYHGTMLGIAEMIRTGTTLVNDIYDFMPYAAKAYLETGFNANVSRGLINPDSNNFENCRRIKDGISLFDEFHNAGDGQIKVELFPHAVYTCSFEYLCYIAKLSKEKNIKISSHLCENEIEVSECLEKYNKTPVEVYKDAGLLDNIANFAHCVKLNENDIKLLKGHYITHNPSSNLKLGSGIADIYHYEKQGIHVALGTDGASSNNSLNMFKEIHLAALLTSLNNGPENVNCNQILEMATKNGALAMDRQAKGMLKEGYDADFIVVSTEEPYHFPKHNAVNDVVYSTLGTDVNLTVIGGKIVYQNGDYKTLDIEKVKHNITKVKEELF